MVKILNNIVCMISHNKWHKLKMKGRVLDHLQCDKCGREFTNDRYSTGSK